MPAGTKVEEMYKALREKGYSKESAARISQSRTGLSLQTGKPSKNKKGLVKGFKYGREK